uniref:Uncharacterized protein n=1 Tax=Brassica oleracea var. oleracea TaxID=109376 RepID=A0A0D3B1Z8_BRAOL
MAEEKKVAPIGMWTAVKPFVNGGASGMLATCVIQPIDMIKVRIQLGQGSAASVTTTMLKNEGIGAFYKLVLDHSSKLKSFVDYLDPIQMNILYHHLYCTNQVVCSYEYIRMLTAKASEANDGKPLPLYQKALCGLTAGAIGACVGSPADLALIRMQADNTLPLAQRRNYTNAFHALLPAMALNTGMLASYDQSAEYMRDNLGLGETSTVVGASAVLGFCAAACSLPFDFVKTQIQKMQPDAQGKYP